MCLWWWNKKNELHPRIEWEIECVLSFQCKLAPLFRKLFDERSSSSPTGSLMTLTVLFSFSLENEEEESKQELKDPIPDSGTTTLYSRQDNNCSFLSTDVCCWWWYLKYTLELRERSFYEAFKKRLSCAFLPLLMALFSLRNNLFHVVLSPFSKEMLVSLPKNSSNEKTNRFTRDLSLQSSPHGQLKYPFPAWIRA